MLTTDRYVLALAMLDGDRAARQVLADMLEEQGERGMAQWAREGRKDKRRTIEFVVTLLPCRPAIGLVAGFIGKASEVIGEPVVIAARRWASNREHFREAIDAVKTAQWEILGRLREHTGSYSIGRLWEYREAERAAGCVDLLINAMQLAAEAERLVASGDSRRAASRDLASRIVLKQIVAATYSHHADRSVRYESILFWQTEQLQQLLKALVASEEDLWPK